MTTLSSLQTPNNVLTGSSTSTITGKTIDLANNTLVATSAQLKAALTDETGSGSAVFAVSPVLATPTVDSLNGGQLSGMREKIINGRMEIDQRNSGAAVTITNTGAIYTVDRFWATRSAAISNYTVQRGSAPASLGFANYLLLTMGTGVTLGATDYASLGQNVEGLNISDLSWGSASARPVTLSFWVRSSVAGTYSASLRNGAVNRSYIVPYTINSANTFEYKTILVPGDTTGTWAVDNTIGLNVNWDFGAGTTYSTTASSWQAGNYFGLTGGVKLATTTGATFLITGVSLKAGDCRNELYQEWRPYAIEEMLCKRYYWQQNVSAGSVDYSRMGMCYAATAGWVDIQGSFRATPAFVLSPAYNTGSGWCMNTTLANPVLSALPYVIASGNGSQSIQLQVASGGSAGYPARLFNNTGSAGYYGLNAEL